MLPRARVAPGPYQLFAVAVHGNGLAETATTTISMAPGKDGAPLGDDAVGTGPPIPAIP